MSIKNYKYWVEWYSKGISMRDPSPFAKFCFPFFEKRSVIDAGCGNGRDGNWFSHMGIDVTSYDMCWSDAINLVVCDVCEINYSGAENIYSRWLLHSLDDNSQLNFLTAACAGLVKGGRLFIECRSVDEDVPDYTHFRNPLSRKKLEDELKARSMVIEHSSQSRGYSRTEYSDPLLIRVVASKDVCI